MTSIALSQLLVGRAAKTTFDRPPKNDWPLISDVASFRGGLPETLIQWRRARGEAPQTPENSKT